MEDGLAMLDAARTRFEARESTFELDMAYIGQTHTVSVPIPVKIKDGRVASTQLRPDRPGLRHGLW